MSKMVVSVEVENMNNLRMISKIAIGAGWLSLFLLLVLHFLSPELDPSWHMISEYAYGRYGGVLTLFFFSWAVSYWCTALVLFPLARHWVYRGGVVLLFLSGLGAMMGGLFDVRHPLHGLAFAIGIPFLPLVAPFLTKYVQWKKDQGGQVVTVLAHASWISFIVMGVSMAMFMSQMQKAGALNMTTPQLLTSLPEGVDTMIGYVNRLLVVSYVGWLMAINYWVWGVRKK